VSGKPDRVGDVELVLSYAPAAREGALFRPGALRRSGALLRSDDLLRPGAGVVAAVVLLGVFAAALQAGPGGGGTLAGVLELLALGCAGVAAWGLPAAYRRLADARRDGERAAERDGPVLRLNRDGVHFRARKGASVVFAPWELVERCEFRPGPGGSPRWCVDAPVALPTSLSFAAAWAGMVPPNRIEDRVGELSATWAALGAPADRHLLRQTLLFGTPIVVDLSRCHGVSVPRLDAVVRAWTFNRCGCDPS
jgi:hypothetical protein